MQAQSGALSASGSPGGRVPSPGSVCVLLVELDRNPLVVVIVAVVVVIVVVVAVVVIMYEGGSCQVCGHCVHGHLGAVGYLWGAWVGGVGRGLVRGRVGRGVLQRGEHSINRIRNTLATHSGSHSKHSCLYLPCSGMGVVREVRVLVYNLVQSRPLVGVIVRNCLLWEVPVL